MNPPSIDDQIDNCWFCGGMTYMNRAFGSEPVAFVECAQCRARGPIVLMSRPDWHAQAIAAWAAGKKFGRVAVANVPGGMPSFTCSLAEKVRLIAEAIYKGEYGEVESLIMLMRRGRECVTVTHNISGSDVVRVLDAVRDASRIRAAVLPPPPEGKKP